MDCPFNFSRDFCELGLFNGKCGLPETYLTKNWPQKCPSNPNVQRALVQEEVKSMVSKFLDGKGSERLIRLIRLVAKDVVAGDSKDKVSEAKTKEYLLRQGFWPF